MNKLLKFLRRWNELLSIPLAFLLWWLSPILIRWIDPTAAVYDAGIFQIILFAVIAFLIFQAMAWIALKLSFPRAYEWLDNELTQLLTTKSLTSWQKSKLVLWLFSLFLASLVLLARVV